MDLRIGHRTPLGSFGFRGFVFVAGLALVAASTPAFATQPCGTQLYPFPFTDVAGVADPFCPGIMEAYVTGITKGTSATTFSPTDNVPRQQMTTFLQRSLDQGLMRTNRRAALNQWWTPKNTAAMQTIGVGSAPYFCVADGENIWTANFGQVVQVQANSGKVLGTWTGAGSSFAALAAAGKVFVTGETAPGKLYVIDPTLPPGAVTVAASNLGNQTLSIAFDGSKIWTANFAGGSGGSVSIITPQVPTPYPVTTVATGFNAPSGVLYDGAHIWVADFGANTLLKVDATGVILQTVTLGSGPHFPVFDGTNIWVPNFFDSSVTVVQASTGSVVATILADATNKLSGPAAASFDGERIMVANFNGDSVTLFKAADLSFIANVSTGTGTFPYGACSDGINFWIPLNGKGNLLRF